VNPGIFWPKPMIFFWPDGKNNWDFVGRGGIFPTLRWLSRPEPGQKNFDPDPFSLINKLIIHVNLKWIIYVKIWQLPFGLCANRISNGVSPRISPSNDRLSFFRRTPRKKNDFSSFVWNEERRRRRTELLRHTGLPNESGQKKIFSFAFF